MKLIYAVAFALFPLAAPAQTLVSSTPAAVCNDDHCDEAGRGSAPEVFSVEAILEKYSAVVTRDTDDEIAGVFTSDPAEIPVGSIRPRSESHTAENAILTDDDFNDEPTGGLETIASKIAAPEVQLDRTVEDADDVAITGPTPQRIPAVAATPVDDNPTIE